MEWVETTARSVEDAVEIALDQLGVDESDMEYEVVQVPRPGVFGIGRAEARIRARVRPQAPRSKDGEGGGRRRSHRQDGQRSTRNSKKHQPQVGLSEVASRDESDAEESQRSDARRNKSRRSNRRSSTTNRQQEGNSDVNYQERGTEVPLREQSECAKRFLEGLLEILHAKSPMEIEINDEDELVTISIEGSQLGHLIGPRGATLQALQELTRTVVQRQTDANNGRIIVDIAGYREKRRAALTQFAHQIAQEVLQSGTKRVLEPMNPADRKVVHDVVNDIEGVSTHSEGESMRRRVVVQPSAESEAAHAG